VIRVERDELMGSDDQFGSAPILSFCCTWMCEWRERMDAQERPPLTQGKGRYARTVEVIVTVHQDSKFGSGNRLAAIIHRIHDIAFELCICRCSFRAPPSLGQVARMGDS
jgi:hypothetical protein